MSAGTELTAYRGTNPYVHKRWDSETRLFVDGEPTFPYPLDAWGYEQVGRVEALGDGHSPGRGRRPRLGSMGAPQRRDRLQEHVAGRVLPAGVDPLCGVFARIGAVALNAVLDADVHVGETVAVFGQGVPASSRRSSRD